MKVSIYDFGGVTEDQMYDILEAAEDSDLAWTKFSQDCPSVLGDEYPEAFNEWLADDFIERLHRGTFDHDPEIAPLLRRDLPLRETCDPLQEQLF